MPKNIPARAFSWQSVRADVSVDIVKIANVVGARPNFVKMAPLLVAQRRRPSLVPYLIHTGQHGENLHSQKIFEELALPRPDVSLHTAPMPADVQFDSIFAGVRSELLRIAPDLVLVVGDVTSTIAAAAAARDLGLCLAHVEAGLRCGDLTMLEEQNRIRTDAMSDLLFASEPAAVENLLNEGIDPGRIHLVGNVMIDTLLRHKEQAASLARHRAIGMEAQTYAIVTLHRRENMDAPPVAAEILEAISEISRRLPVVFPAHPRARFAIEKSAAIARAMASGQLLVLPPQSYLEMLSLTMSARLVATDSGGLQEETSFLRVPCLTLRDHTERPLTVTDGTNRIAGRTKGSILRALDEVLAADPRPPSEVAREWDGQASERIASRLAEHGGQHRSWAITLERADPPTHGSRSPSCQVARFNTAKMRWMGSRRPPSIGQDRTGSSREAAVGGSEGDGVSPEGRRDGLASTAVEAAQLEAEAGVKRHRKWLFRMPEDATILRSSLLWRCARRLDHRRHPRTALSSLPCGSLGQPRTGSSSTRSRPRGAGASLCGLPRPPPTVRPARSAARASTAPPGARSTMISMRATACCCACVYAAFTARASDVHDGSSPSPCLAWRQPTLVAPHAAPPCCGPSPWCWAARGRHGFCPRWGWPSAPPPCCASCLGHRSLRWPRPGLGVDDGALRRGNVYGTISSTMRPRPVDLQDQQEDRLCQGHGVQVPGGESLPSAGSSTNQARLPRWQPNPRS
jgi:UDP-N-acetylglucosamine 2-epimerase (non-hydrolysing)